MLIGLQSRLIDLSHRVISLKIILGQSGANCAISFYLTCLPDKRTYVTSNIYIYIYIYIYISGGPLSALTCCVNVRLLSAIKKISPLIYSQSWVGSWVYTTQAMMTFTLIF